MGNIEFGKKQESILRSGHDLFWKHGFRRVSVEEICRQAGVSKMTFYRYYSDKTVLAKAVYERVNNESMQTFREIMASDMAPSEKMKSMILMKSEAVKNISQEFLKDFYSDSDNGLKEFIQQKTVASSNEIVQIFKLAQANGQFRSDFKPEFLLFISQKFVEIINDSYLKSLYESPQEMVMELVKIFTYGISPKE
jgi:AcrR family transcriptional regulator